MERGLAMEQASVCSIIGQGEKIRIVNVSLPFWDAAYGTCEDIYDQRCARAILPIEGVSSDASDGMGCIRFAS